jgi:ADP-dependent NAD(P)H-hydrate dehydratase
MTASPDVKEISALPVLAPRRRDANKGDFGRVLVVAGSRGMTGAAILCASAALRGGAGLVRVAVAEGLLPLVAVGNPCYMTVGLPQDPHGRLGNEGKAELVRLVSESTVAVLGPGLGRSPDLARLLVAVLKETTTPLVLDADALNNLADHAADLGRRAGPVVLTPHPGEFGRLVGHSAAEVQADRRAQALAFARQAQVVLVLKGQGTLVTDGTRLYINGTGNPGMATGGTGDVLGGLIGALLAQHLEPFAAAQLGVHLHGLAGDLAAARLGEVSLIASDLLDSLPLAFRAHAANHP